MADVPEAVEDKPEKEEVKDDKKEEKKEDKAHKFRGEPKEDPGDGLQFEAADKIKEIEFKWDKNMKDKKSCNTLHMLYLLQLALNLVRLRTIERNKYFKSIGRSDRFINQLDNPQIIENFLEWHNKDKEKNKFDGELLDKSEKLHMINNIISEIGGVKKGPATKIYTKLKKDVVIETTTWLELPQPKLKLKSKTFIKLYAGEKVIGECTKEDIVTLLTYVNPDAAAWAPEGSEEKKDDDGKEILRGVFQSIKWSNNFKNAPAKKPKPSALECEVILNGQDGDAGAVVKGAEGDTLKLKRRWEDLIVAFFEGKERIWEYDGGKVDCPHNDQAGCDKSQKIQEGTSPKDLGLAGKGMKPKGYDGKAFEDTSVKQLCQECMDYLIPPEVKNVKGKPFNTKLRGGVNQILRELKKVYVQGILDAAKKK